MQVTPLAAGLTWIDLNFRGRPHAIATAVIDGGGTLGLVDPGPTPCLETLELGLQGRGLRLTDVTHLLLTHIHLDHAAAAGAIVRRCPSVRVLVHERGAPHMADPSRLLVSAQRLYGNRMNELWGEVVPVPAANLVVLKGGERVDVGGRTFEVAYTPGHASHHVSYFDAASGVAFVGDTAGVCIDGGYVLPPTPPPDIDVELWEKSVGVIEAWAPGTLFLTHFGPVSGVRPHLQEVVGNLRSLAKVVRDLVRGPGTDEEKRARFVEHMRTELRRRMTDAQFDAYSLAVPADLLWLGLVRYWQTRAA